MKKFTLSVVTVLAMSTLAIAGGDIAPVEPVVEVEAPIDDSSFYVGLGYSAMNMNNDAALRVTAPGFGVNLLSWSPNADISGDALSLIAGYNFNKYIGVEGRYSATFGDLTFDNGTETDYNGDMSNIALYLKPMYPMGGITLYGLLGYGEVTVEDDFTEYSESGFQWGLGASYAMTENIGIFVDYTTLYDDTGFDTVTIGDYKVDSINFGLTYTF
ncbi:MAG: porin family protein [Sulfurovum sp.]|uniref:porin family protein n=1 Tax=Sulfurovum sp. TaxID=1969726 RepID=UPI0028682F7C|nr:porin family protein [Sulfurovum sp.]MCO4845035.1 porin family protein [Sulfurovum sp.]